jgi:hypothetical protein
MLIKSVSDKRKTIAIFEWSYCQLSYHNWGALLIARRADHSAGHDRESPLGDRWRFESERGSAGALGRPRREPIQEGFPLRTGSAFGQGRRLAWRSHQSVLPGDCQDRQEEIPAQGHTDQPGFREVADYE